MPAKPNAFHVLSQAHPGLSGSGAPAANGPHAGEPAQLVRSAELLQGHKAIGILHNGALYRLQSTKLGKLILTK